MNPKSKRPFIKRFKTSRGYYVYDINTNRIISVSNVVYDILSDFNYLTPNEIIEKYALKYGRIEVKKALDEIEIAHKKEMLFLSNRPIELSNAGLSHEEFQQSYNNQLGQMILDITQDCNLRCHYCSREWNNDEWDGSRYRMPKQIALDAIDFLYDHSSQIENPALCFYGGEPLLEFGLIKQCVDHAYSKLGCGGIHFSLTTNGTLIDENKAKYFADNQFNVTVSIDGPQHIHDKHRVDINGRGSYKNTIKGLRLLYEAYGDDAPIKIPINMVITPPYDLDAINDLWVEQPWLPKNITLLPSYVNTEYTNFLEVYGRDISKETSRRARRRVQATFRRDCLNGEPWKSPIASVLFEKPLVRIYKRPLFQPPRDVYPINGCCIPATRKVFVTFDGKLWMCERVHDSPSIGSIYKGYDDKTMRDLVDTYIKDSYRDCSRCLAVGMCTLCFVHVYTNAKFDIERKRKFCKNQRKNLTSQLKTYCSILEQDPHAFDYMESIVMS